MLSGDLSFDPVVDKNSAAMDTRPAGTYWLSQLIFPRFPFIDQPAREDEQRGGMCSHPPIRAACGAVNLQLCMVQ